jgi:hypothetical protein
MSISYAAFLTWLLAFKDQLPAILADIETAVTAIMSAYERIKGSLPAQAFELSDEEQKLETDLAVAMAAPTPPGMARVCGRCSSSQRTAACWKSSSRR